MDTEDRTMLLRALVGGTWAGYIADFLAHRRVATLDDDAYAGVLLGLAGRGVQLEVVLMILALVSVGLGVAFWRRDREIRTTANRWVLGSALILLMAAIVHIRPA